MKSTFALAAASMMILAGSTEAATIAAHRAIYDVSLASEGNTAKLQAVDGRMAFEVMGAGCEGWTVNFRIANRYVPNEGEPRLADTQSTSYETADGTRFDYAEKSFINQKLESEARLKVTREGISAKGDGHITLPEEKDFTLEGGVYFPMAHQLHFMDLAQAGQTHDSSLIYDGSDDENGFRAVTFIGKEKPPGANSRDAADPMAAPLAKLRSWPITVSYFKLGDDQQDTPEYQVSFDLYENGVSTGLKMDYGTFKLDAKLSHLEMLPQEKCE